MQHFEQKLECRYHTQDASDSCGAAIATSILLHFRLPYESLDQASLQCTLSNLTNLPGVGASPEALSWLLNEKSGRLDFFTTRSRSIEELNRRVVDSIVRRSLPVAVPIFESAHWVVVDGVQTTVKPAVGISYSLRGVWIHNPVPNGDGPPPPHSDDDECGIGLSDRGVIKEFVTARQWNLDVESTLKALVREFRLACVIASCPGNLRLPGTETVIESERPLNEAQAVQAAVATFEEYGLHSHVHPCGKLRPGEPHLAHLEQDPGIEYYLVPWRDDRGFLAFSRIDRQAGWLRSVGFTSKPIQQYINTREKVFELLLDRVSQKFRSMRFRRMLGHKVARGIESWLRRRVDSSRLVWRPSLQSLSPYFPLQEISLRPFKSRIYIDQSGGIHRDLTDPIIGG